MKSARNVEVEVDYRGIVTRAEKAVAVVKDPELRRAAFERILERLLQPSKGERPVPKQPKGGAAGNKRTRGGPTAYIEELIDEGFFKQQRSFSQVKSELANRGHHVAKTSLSGPLQKLCQNKRLRRERSGPAGEKPTYCYSQW